VPARSPTCHSARAPADPPARARAGMIAPAILASVGGIPQDPAEVTWFRTGVIQPAGTYRYWTDPYSLFFLEVVAMQFAELKRWQDFRHPGSQGKQYFLGLEQVLQGSGNPPYPGARPPAAQQAAALPAARPLRLRRLAASPAGRGR